MIFFLSFHTSHPPQMFPIFRSNLSSKHQTLVLLKRLPSHSQVGAGPWQDWSSPHLPPVSPPHPTFQSPSPGGALLLTFHLQSLFNHQPSHTAKLTVPFPSLSANACHQFHHYFNFTNFTRVHPQPCLSIPCPLPPATADPPRAQEEGGCVAGCPSPWGAIPARPCSVPWQPGLAVPL